ncbi:MAG: hypothetical protein ACRCTY_03185, partial [Candidatus Adiutrix sp.]
KAHALWPLQLAPEGQTTQPTNPFAIWPWQFNFMAPASSPLTANALNSTDGDLGALLDFQGKVQALSFGAAIVGAAEMDARFIYNQTLDGRTIEIGDGPEFSCHEGTICLPRQANRVLMVGFVREPSILGLTPALGRIKPQNWLSWEEQIEAVLKISQFIALSGYMAFPAAGGLLLADHFGVLAGLGELGRQGLLITPEYGPEPRLFSIITDYPFEPAHISPDFAIAAYCDTCQRCINECPAKAISDGHRRLTDVGLWQWPLNRQACFENWLNKKEACLKCIEICPYTREPLLQLL